MKAAEEAKDVWARARREERSEQHLHCGLQPRQPALRVAGLQLARGRSKDCVHRRSFGLLHPSFPRHPSLQRECIVPCQQGPTNSQPACRRSERSQRAGVSGPHGLHCESRGAGCGGGACAQGRQPRTPQPGGGGMTSQRRLPPRLLASFAGRSGCGQLQRHFAHFGVVVLRMKAALAPDSHLAKSGRKVVISLCNRPRSGASSTRPRIESYSIKRTSRMPRSKTAAFLAAASDGRTAPAAASKASS